MRGNWGQKTSATHARRCRQASTAVLTGSFLSHFGTLDTLTTGMPKKIQTHLKQKTWRCSEKEGGSVRVIIIIISLFLLERGEGGGGGSCTRAGAVQNTGSRKPFFFFYLGHARSDGGSGDEDHVGSKLSRPEDLQRLWRRDGETCYWGRTIGKKINSSIHSGGQLISEWRRFCHI